ncbi:short-chain dehydrogenase [Alishewanella longhuensis]|uniref:Short-chain dehydrogenase n=1 Tax=Alishewanella longhuensis TaxID=1091037 RepID=A0ABQ3KV99_9ALTE|nr:SDR family NAD(P)-dependent oxidoreductase [Alishewanella longhuensis]GHG63680.1 short-chain dehydrogenase [Alishewanella longhuensis]
MSATILITGASSGIGRETALYYAQQGWNVYALARSTDKLAELAMQFSDKIVPVSLDLTDMTAMQIWLSTLPVTLNFDVVLLNAGNCEYVDATDLDLAAFERTFAINFQAVVASTKLLLPRLKAGNTLAIVSSMAHFFPFTRSEAYGASKAAVSYFTESLRVDLANTGINVCLIEPGFIDTPLTQKNDFAMPFLMPVAKAAKRIFDGINAGKLRLRFPRRLGYLLRALSLLPYGMRSKLAARMKQS